MPTLQERLDQRLVALSEERGHLVTGHQDALAKVDTRIAALQSASRLLSTEFEQAYQALVRLGLIQEI